MSADNKVKLVALGGLLQRIGNFNPHTYESDFNSRLIQQKTVYLMEQFGLNIGYSFSWYLRGPYSPNLTRDTYEMAKTYSEISPVKFADPKMEQRFCTFLEFIRPISRDTFYLEKLAVVHFLYSMYPKLSQKEVFNKVHAKISSVDFNEFEQLLSLLKTYNLIGEN